MAVEATYSTPYASSVPLTRGGSNVRPLLAGGRRGTAQCAAAPTLAVPGVLGGTGTGTGPPRHAVCSSAARPLAALALAKPAPPAAFAAHVARPARLTAQVRDHLELAPADDCELRASGRGESEILRGKCDEVVRLVGALRVAVFVKEPALLVPPVRLKQRRCRTHLKQHAPVRRLGVRLGVRRGVGLGAGLVQDPVGRHRGQSATRFGPRLALGP